MSYELRNLTGGAPGEDNQGGVVAAWYAYAADLVDFPYQGPLAIDQLTLRPGATFYQVVSTRQSVRYKQTPKDLGRHGQSFTQQLTGTLARHAAALAQGLEALDGQELVLLYRDLNGEVQLVGTPEQPLRWSDAYDSGETFAQRNNYDWKLLGETLRRARPYLGTWPVSEAGPQGPVLGTGTGGTIELRTAGGRLLARVPAGRTLILHSDFALGYQIR